MNRLAPPVLPLPGRTGRLLLEGPAGTIEAEVAAPVNEIEPRGFAVVCHPHPLHGGALTNKVAYTLAATAVKHGLAALRFNFRGVGRSAGSHDEGRGETQDTLAVIEWMRSQMPEAELLLAGFSFGAYIALKASVAARPRALVSIAPPFKYFTHEPLPPRPGCPWLVVHGVDDEVVPYAETRKVLEGYEPMPELVTTERSGHFFHGQLHVLQEAVGRFLGHHWSGTAEPPPPRST